METQTLVNKPANKMSKVGALGNFFSYIERSRIKPTSESAYVSIIMSNLDNHKTHDKESMQKAVFYQRYYASYIKHPQKALELLKEGDVWECGAQIFLLKNIFESAKDEKLSKELRNSLSKLKKNGTLEPEAKQYLKKNL